MGDQRANAYKSLASSNKEKPPVATKHRHSWLKYLGSDADRADPNLLLA
jgi:hypothetical protein